MKLFENRKKKKKKNGTLTTTAVAAMTAAGVMVGGAMSSPEDTMSDSSDVIVQTIAVTPQVQVDAGGSDGGAEEAVVVEEEKKRGRFASVQKAMRAAPFEMRARLAIPLWIAGSLMAAFLSSLWMGVLPPLAAAALSWALTALMAVLIFVLAVKTVFPDMPLKKILNRKTFLGIGILCLVCGILDAALPFFWDDYTMVSRLLKVLGSAACTGVPIVYFLRRRKRAGPQIEAEPVEPPPPPEPTMAEKEAAARALVQELADSVSRRNY